MKDYIKPTFTLAGLFPVALAGNSCHIDSDTRDFLIDMNDIVDWSKAFYDGGDGCSEETYIEGYCKFNYADTFGSDTIVFGS